MTAPSPDLSELRAHLPSLADAAYFNTGYCGPLPTVAAGAMREALEAELRNPRGRADAYEELKEMAAAVKVAFSRLLTKCDPADVALTDSTSEGLGLAIAGLGLSQGDEIVTTSEEHMGMGAVLAAAELAFGAVLKVVPFAPPGGDLASVIESAISARTRAVAISHISYSSGRAADMAAISARLPAGVPLLVDAAHTVGAVECDPAVAGVAVLAFPGQKWCLGPEGVGGMWIAPGWQERLSPTVVSYRAMEHWRSFDDWDWAPRAGRFDGGSVSKPLLVGMRAALGFLTSDVGFHRAIELTRHQAGSARRELAAVPGVRVTTPPDEPGGLVSFTIEGLSNEDDYAVAAGELWNAGVRLRKIPDPPCLRASVAFFNTDEDLDRLVSAVDAICP